MAHFGFNDVTGCLSGSNAQGTGIRFSQSPLRRYLLENGQSPLRGSLLENGQSPLRRYLLENGQVYGQSFEVQACWRLLGVVWAIVNRGPSWPPLKCWCSTQSQVLWVCLSSTKDVDNCLCSLWFYDPSQDHTNLSTTSSH